MHNLEDRHAEQMLRCLDLVGRDPDAEDEKLLRDEGDQSDDDAVEDGCMGCISQARQAVGGQRAEHAVQHHERESCRQNGMNGWPGILLNARSQI